MAFDYSLLRGKIKDKFKTYGNFALNLGIPYQRMTNLLSGKAKWNDELMYKAADLLGIVGSIEQYFFTEKSHKDEL